MAKDYFQDILPPNSSHEDENVASPAPKYRDDIQPPLAPIPAAATPERSIRNISVPNRTRSSEPREPMTPMPPRPRSNSAIYLWVVVAVLAIGLGGIAVVAWQPTSVTITPRTHPVVFDQTTSSYLAYPAAQAATGTLPYSTQSFDFEDSEVVSSQGVTHVEEKASGSITVYNDFATTPVKLIKNTRFSTPDGLIFRTPADITIPGKKGKTPGSVVVTVIADAAGQQYNVAPVKFSVPGLASNAAMSAGVYAKSSAPFTNGFSGDRPGVSNEVMNTAVATMKSRISDQLKASLAKIDGGVALPGLARVTFTDVPATAESPQSTRLHLKAHVDAVILPIAPFAAAIAESAGSDTQSVTMHFAKTSGFDATYAGSSTPALGTDPISFVTSGTATIVWDVDTAALAKSLANHDKGAFQTIVDGFPAIQEAHARVEPFWSTRFPADPTSIHLTVVAPKTP